MRKIILVAETDTERRIVALWRAGGALVAPRVVRSAQEALDVLPQAEVAGAARAEAEAWLGAWQAQA